MALRFARLARPLGTIKTWLRFSVQFSSPETDPYWQKLAKASTNDGLDFPPLPANKDDVANDILMFVPDTTLFFYRTPNPPGPKLSQEPDLSVSLGRNPAPDQPDNRGSGPSWWQSNSGIEYRNARSFSFVSGSLESEIEDTNQSDNRYSNGKTTSIVDVYGSQLVIRMCSGLVAKPGPTKSRSRPAGARNWTITVLTEDNSIRPLVVLKSIDIEFPGRQDVQI